MLARTAWLGEPCHAPCRTAADHALIFDETYYVNAARRIAGVEVPRGGRYASAPAGLDPNSEHPALGKVLVAALIEADGDGPLAWRLPALAFGTLTLAGIFGLARAAGASQPVALAATALAATENLILVHGRIGTLDVLALGPMLLGAALYLRERALAGGALIGIGAAGKLIAPCALIALAVWELLRPDRDRPRAALRRLASATAAAAVTLLTLLAVTDRIAPPWDPNSHRPVGGGVLGHLTHMTSFAAAQVSGGGPAGIASYPWTWWADWKPIVYLNIDARHPEPGLRALHPDVHFLGLISPPVLLLGIVGLWLAARRLRERESDLASRRLAALTLAWTAGTWLPFALASALDARTSYLYYMLPVLPGALLAGATVLADPRISLTVRRFTIATIAIAAIALYPLTPLPG